MPLALILYYIFCDLSTVFWRGKVTPPARTTSKNRGGAQTEQPTAPHARQHRAQTTTAKEKHNCGKNTAHKPNKRPKTLYAHAHAHTRTQKQATTQPKSAPQTTVCGTPAEKRQKIGKKSAGHRRKTPGAPDIIGATAADAATHNNNITSAFFI